MKRMLNLRKRSMSSVKHRNQRMAEDQSVVGRRIYHDPYGNETLMCSDGDEENAEPEEEKHEFSEGEDQILWKALQENGFSPDVVDILNQFIGVAPSEIEENDAKNSDTSGSLMSEGRSFLDKTSSAALDSSDNLFCRRCLVFDCHLHGCCQSLITPSENSHMGLGLKNKKTCGDHSYLKKRSSVL